VAVTGDFDLGLHRPSEALQKHRLILRVAMQQHSSQAPAAKLLQQAKHTAVALTMKVFRDRTPSSVASA
jgi:hypothetical protein